MRRLVRILGLGLLGSVLIGGPVNAGAPTTERIPIDETFVDDFLTEACGAEVTAHVTGHVTFRVFTNAAGDPVRELNNYAVHNAWSSANGSLRANDVGVDRITYLPDGSLLQVVIGNVQSISIPGQGRVYADVGQTTVHITFDANGDPIFTVLEQHGQHEGDQLEALCSVLG